RVWFADDGAGLDVGPSSEQLENVAAILKAYPTWTLEIPGYDDAAARAASGLAPARAAALKNQFVSLGVAEPRLKAAGNGRPPPRCPPTTAEECRSTDTTTDAC